MASLFFALDKHIVNINLHVLSNLFSEHLVHQPLVGSSYVLQLEWHDSITIKSLTGDECNLLLVLFWHLDLVVSWEYVHERLELMSCCWVDKLVNSRQWEAILWVGIIQVREIHTFSLFLLPFLPWWRWPTNSGNRLLHFPICLLNIWFTNFW